MLSVASRLFLAEKCGCFFFIFHLVNFGKMSLFFSDKFLAFSGPHNKSRIENGESAIWEMNEIIIEIDRSRMHFKVSLTSEAY